MRKLWKHRVKRKFHLHIYYIGVKSIVDHANNKEVGHSDNDLCLSHAILFCLCHLSSSHYYFAYNLGVCAINNKLTLMIMLINSLSVIVKSHQNMPTMLSCSISVLVGASPLVQQPGPLIFLLI